MKKLLLLFALIITYSAQGQEWQINYDKGMAAFNDDDYQLAFIYFKAAKSELTASKDTLNGYYANCCSYLADIYYYEGEYTQAAPFYEGARNIYETLYGKEHIYYAISCYNLANLNSVESQFARAENLYLESKQIIETLNGKDHQDYVNCCLGLASNYKKQGQYAKAESYYLESKSIIEKIHGKGNTYYAVACNNLASLYEHQGKYELAESLLMEAKNIIAATKSKDDPDYASTCNNLAHLYEDQGLYNKAELLYLEAKEIYENVYGKEHPQYASACNNLALLYQEVGQYTYAELLLIEAKTIREKVLGKNQIDYATTCNNLAQLYYDKRLYAKAEQLYVETKSIIEQILGDEHPYYAFICSNLADVYQAQGLFPKAELLYLKSISIIEKVLGTEHPSYATSCAGLARLYCRQELYAKADPFYRKILANKTRQLTELLPTLSEAERKEYLHSIQAYFVDFTTFAIAYSKENPSITADLFNLQLITKAAIFHSTQKMRENIQNSGDTTLIHLYQVWKDQHQFLDNVMQLPIAEQEKLGLTEEAIDSLKLQANEFERQLSKRSATFASENDHRIYTWQDIQKTLKPGEAVVDIIRAESVYIALLVKPETIGQPQMIVIGSTTQIDRQLKYYRNYITLQSPDLKTYAVVWAPIASQLKGVDKVYASLDGSYHQMNLLTLFNPTSNKYLLEEKNIQLLSNSKDMLTLHREELHQQYQDYHLYILAYPQYDGGVALQPRLGTDTLQQPLAATFTLLPGTQKEAEMLAALSKKQKLPVDIKLSKDATEEFAKSLHNPGILHIATHGFFLTSGSDSIQNYQPDPLLQSGLILANGMQGMEGLIIEGEDGVLTAKEAMNLNLDQTELVVLSACETGLGVTQYGEGVYGLQRSFQQAGAKTILISLWKVNDAVTQQLMIVFYHNLLVQKYSKREAFNLAQEHIRQKHPNPYYWGAFVMIGE